MLKHKTHSAIVPLRAAVVTSLKCCCLLSFSTQGHGLQINQPESALAMDGCTRRLSMLAVIESLSIQQVRCVLRAAAPSLAKHTDKLKLMCLCECVLSRYSFD